MKNLIKLLLTAQLFVLSQNIYAQKLPGKQEESVYAPSAVKIDGKTTEWTNGFKAFNHATEIYYTIANDEQYLYLVIQATNRTVINKIISGGISFTVNTTGDKKSGGATVTYPVFEWNKRPALNVSKSFYEQSQSGINVPDSVAMANNRSLEKQSKLIMTTGIKGVDTLISVYNDNDIKVAERFDHKMAYTYELALPLANIGLAAGDPVKFNYHIMLNGTSPLPGNTKSISKIQLSPGGGNDPIEAKLGLEAQLTAPTDFWGEYTLAKK